MLVSQALEFARAEGLRMLMLFTSAQEDAAGEGFHGTRAFYRQMGFNELCVLKPEGWTKGHLLMARAL
jgi:GNAT superfamily N-acetyltransferase